MTRTSDRPLLTEAFRALAAKNNRSSLPHDSFRRLVDKIEGGQQTGRRRRWLLALGFAGATVASFGAVALWRTLTPTRLNGFELVTASHDLRWHALREATVEILRGDATLRLRDLGVDVTVSSRTRLQRESAGIRVMAGTATFSVQTRPRDLPMRVLVSSGTIEVIGTRFIVRQESASGSVLLEIGVVQFISDTGRTTILRAGDTLRWSGKGINVESKDGVGASAVPPELGISPPELEAQSGRKPLPIARKMRVQNAVSDTALFAEIETLRIRHEYEPLAKKLGQALEKKVDEPLRESLSVELVDLLIRHGGKEAGACDRIAQHLQSYPRGEHSESLAKAAAKLGCVR